MSSASIESLPAKESYDDMPSRKPFFSTRPKKLYIGCGFVLVVIAVALGVGLGIGLSSGRHPNSSSASAFKSATSMSATEEFTKNKANLPTRSTFWRPAAGASWQIVLPYPLKDTSVNASIYDIDLFINPTSTIKKLHKEGRKVICYFSAGSYEPDRPDSGQFTPSDKGKQLEHWPGEYWLNTKSTNVRRIMAARLALAASKGCDGVDPDNVDAYNNNNGLGLQRQDAINYLTFLATTAHNLNMAIGLKNAAEIISQTINMMQWQVNEECHLFRECASFQPFIAAGKPVFHLEYPDDAPNPTAAEKAAICGDKGAAGFSTLLKTMDLDDWFYAC